MGDQLVPGRVVERAEHAGHVPQRRGPGAPLGQRAGWLALEVEHDPAGLGPHDLAQVVVAVHPLVTRPDVAPSTPSTPSTPYSSLAPKAADWVRRNGDAFCAGYAAAGGLDPAENSVLLRAMLLDKAVYEVIYEARNRPTWVAIPLESIAEL